MKLNIKKLQKAGTIPLKQDYQFYKGQYDPELKAKIQARAEANKPVNTTSEFIIDPKTMTAKRNPNAKMGLEIVSPEFQLMTAGVGSLAGKASTIIGKIGQTMLHGAGQGAMANMSNLSGSEQSASGLAQDVLGGAVVGGLLKGTGVVGKKLSDKVASFLPSKFNNKITTGNLTEQIVKPPIGNSSGEIYLRSVNAKEKELSKLLQSGNITFDDLSSQIKLYKQKTSKDLGFGEKLGEGKYGEVFELNDTPNSVIKLGNPFGNKWTPELIESLKGLRNSGNIAIPEEVSYLNIPSEYAGYSPSTKEIVKMPNLNKSNFKKLNLDKRNRYALFLKQVRQLRDKGIAVDADNLENFKFNSEKNVFDIYDVNPSHINNPGAYMRYVVGKTKNSLLDSMQYKQGGKLIPKGQQGLIFSKSNVLSPLDPNKQFNNSKFNFLNLPKTQPLLNFMGYKNIGYDSDTVLKLIDKFEGFKDKVYKDGKGIDTIGHGLTNKKYIQKGNITREESLQGVKEHINNEVIPYLTSKPYWSKLNNNQKSALISYVYNIGSGNFNTESPSLQKALSENNWKEAAKEMNFGYNDKKNPGLKERRDIERQLFLQ